MSKFIPSGGAAGLAGLIVKVGDGYSLLGGGNDRGENAVDLQIERYADTQVASGDYSTVGGGYSNTASGDYSTVGGGSCNTASYYGAVAGGYENDATGDYSAIGGGSYNEASGARSAVGGGEDNTASGDYSAVGGGYDNTASGDYSAILGGKQAIADKYGQVSHASGRFSTDGDAQVSDLVARIVTSNTTPTELFLDGSSEKITIATDTTWAFSIMVVARRYDARDEGAGYKLEGVIDNNNGTTALVGAVTKTVIAEDDADWDCDVTADNTNDALKITVTGETDKTIRWVARIDLVEVSGFSS